MKFEFKKSLGQNFLKNEQVLEHITSLVQEDKPILEIGPGAGALTKYLVKKNKVLAIETDKRLKEYLDKIDNLEVIYDDIMQVDLDKVLDKNVIVVANLPYYITTPIITKLMDNSKIDEMILMVQKEVAERIVAKPHTKDYGYFTVLVQSRFDTTLEFVVEKDNFIPVPKVDSAVIKLVKNEKIGTTLLDKFDKLIKDAFAMKRKNLKNNLKDYDLGKIEEVLKKYNLTLQARAEEVPVLGFIEIIKVL